MLKRGGRSLAQKDKRRIVVAIRLTGHEHRDLVALAKETNSLYLADAVRRLLLDAITIMKAKRQVST